jgi:hypothetical protein
MSKLNLTHPRVLLYKANQRRGRYGCRLLHGTRTQKLLPFIGRWRRCNFVLFHFPADFRVVTKNGGVQIKTGRMGTELAGIS